MRYIVPILTLICFFEYINTQYLTMNRKLAKPPSCESSEKTVLVEHFFNVIFTEFQSTPPVCVCVQMCVDQSTYCYPNGCLKREDKKKTQDNFQPVSIQSGNARSSIFMVNQKNDFMADLLSKGYGDDAQLTNTESEKVDSKELRRDIFKDNYKTLFKYKKMPKVELRYNLREQVKNTKSDILKIESIDVSKTRWPMKKHTKLNGHHTDVETSEGKPIGMSNNKFFLSMYPENEVPKYPPRYSKRDLTNVNEEGVNIKAVYTLDKSDVEVQNSNFSLETLIDNLIKSSFERNNSEFEINIDFINGKSDEINKTTSNELFKDNLVRNETMQIISINLTDENLETNKYTDETVNDTNILNDMITSLSRKIDKRNNTSMEMIGRINGDVEITHDEPPNAITDKESITTETTTRETSNISDTKTTSNMPDTVADIAAEKVAEVVTNAISNPITEYVSPVNHVTFPTTDHNEVKTTKKSRQSFLRKMQNRKTN